jgi:hypothetical protein
MSCSPVKINQVSEKHVTSIFRAEIRQARNQDEASSKLLHAGFLPGLVMELTFTRLHSIISQQLEPFIICENLKSYI